MKGTLSEGVLPGVLRELYVGRKTGSLHCEAGGERRSVRVHRGTIINAETSVAQDHLGEMLVRRGLITPDDLAEATEVVVREKRKLGQVFVDMRLLDRDSLEDAIALQAREILTKVFTWNEGSFEFVERPDAPLDGELTLKLSTGELILEAVRAIQDPDVIRYALGDIGRPLTLSNDPLLRFQKLTLSPTDGFVLSRVDGTTSAREIVQMIPVPAEETRKSLFGLLCTGIIEVKEENARATESRPVAAPPATVTPRSPAPPAPPPPVVKEDSPWTIPVNIPSFTPPAPTPVPVPHEFTAPAPPRAPDPPRPAPAPPPAAPAPLASVTPRRFDPAAEARRQEILEAYAGLKVKTHFEVLGIPRASTEAQVKEAYFGLAKRFHPDVHHDPSLGDLRDRLEAVFIRLGEAYETLRNPRTRASYEQRLGASSPRTASASAGPAPPPTPIDPGAVLRAAELQVHLAEKHFEQEKYWDAIQALEPAVQVVTGKMKQRARVLLARAYLKNPKWVKRAEETLLAVVQDDDKNVDGHFLLGKIYKQQGLKTRSQTMLRRALELNPDHQQAADELAEFAPEPEPPETGGGGFIRKLFGGKKG